MYNKYSLSLLAAVLILFSIGILMVFNTTAAEVLDRSLDKSTHHAFFKQLAQTMPEQLLLVLAIKDNTYVGAALSFIGSNTLYGRYWGCYEEYNSLHFETCYYQGLEFCLEHQLQRFDSGAQGEHKIFRGFEPITTYSAHWIQNPQFSKLIANFLVKADTPTFCFCGVYVVK